MKVVSLMPTSRRGVASFIAIWVLILFSILLSRVEHERARSRNALFETVTLFVAQDLLDFNFLKVQESLSSLKAGISDLSLVCVTQGSEIVTYIGENNPSAREKSETLCRDPGARRPVTKTITDNLGNSAFELRFFFRGTTYSSLRTFEDPLVIAAILLFIL